MPLCANLRVVSVVVKVVNSILLNHDQFQALVDKVDVQYGELLCDLRKESATFLALLLVY